MWDRVDSQRVGKRRVGYNHVCPTTASGIIVLLKSPAKHGRTSLKSIRKKTMDFHFSCHTPSTFREELMDFTLFYCFFIFVLDGPGMRRPLGMNARPMRGTCHQEDKQT